MAQRRRFETVLAAVTILSLALTTVAQKERTSARTGRSGEPAARRERSRILVAPAVKVSQSNSSSPHWEVQIAADPTETKRLIACAIMFRNDPVDDERTYLRPLPSSIVVYTSFDGGETWHQTYELNNQQQNVDPTCAFGPDGTGYFMSFGGDLYGMARWQHREFKARGSTEEFMRPPEALYRMPMYRSIDNAKTWVEAGVLDTADREYITADDTNGKYRGRVYVNGMNNGPVGIGIPGLDGRRTRGLTIFHSTNRGETYAWVKLAADRSPYILENGNGVVMADGTFATIFGDGNFDAVLSLHDLHPSVPNAQLKFISSVDGGETFSKATVISDWYLRIPPVLSGMPSLAVDRTNGPFHDRLYAAWVDARSGRGEIRFARSDDHGKTWFPSFVISDNWPRDERGETPDAFMPTLAVNHNGILGVLWYDRRDHSDNLGYDIRFSGSLDGGESFLPSVLVSRGGGAALQMKELRLTGPVLMPTEGDGRAHAAFGWAWGEHGGDTAGLACDLDGIFHPLWIDRLSGIQQVSTARVTVDGTAMLNGGEGLESLGDLSRKAEVRYSMADVDLITNEVSIGAAITNTSNEAIPGRLTLRLLGLSSNGQTRVQNADNGVNIPGAIWEFHTKSGESLRPGALTVPRLLQFKLARSFFPQAQLPSKFENDLFRIDTKILGDYRSVQSSERSGSW